MEITSISKELYTLPRGSLLLFVTYTLITSHSFRWSQLLCKAYPDSPATKIPSQLVVDSWISAQEESWMGVDAEETARWRNENEVPDTDGITEVIESLKQDRVASTGARKTACQE